jgi:hypothetical protein
MGAYNIDFDADKTAVAAGELTLHIGTKDRSGVIAQQSTWPGPTGYTRVGGSPQSDAARRPANVVKLQPDHLDRG